MKDYKNIQIKTFVVRVKHSRTKSDEIKLNRFLKKVDIKQIYTNLVQGEIPYYAYSIHYKEKGDEDSK